jgi:hypothetical protein
VNRDVTRAIDHVRVRHDEPVAGDNDAGARCSLTHQGVGSLLVFIRCEAITGDDDLNHGLRNALRQFLYGRTELTQRSSSLSGRCGFCRRRASSGGQKTEANQNDSGIHIL